MQPILSNKRKHSDELKIIDLEIEIALKEKEILELRIKKMKHDTAIHVKYTEDTIHKQCLRILDILMKQQWSQLYFNEPVDDLVFTDYSTIIKCPMDFGTIKKKLGKDSKKSTYNTHMHFASDVRLVFQNFRKYNNCIKYNVTDRLKIANEYEDLFEKEYNEILNS